MTQTFSISVAGTIILFFLFLIDDTEGSYWYYYRAFFTLLFLNFGFSFIGRALILNTVKS